MILGFDATTLVGRISGVGYYTARLIAAWPTGPGPASWTGWSVLSNRPVDVSPGPRLEVHERGRFAVRSVWMQSVLPGCCAACAPTWPTSPTTWPRSCARCPTWCRCTT